MEEQTEVTLPPAGALDPMKEARLLAGEIQFNLQIVLSALVLERQHPAILAGDAALRNNHLCAILAQTLDAFPHLFEHLEGKQNGNEEQGLSN